MQPENPVQINLPEFKEWPEGDSVDSPDYWFLSEDEKAEFDEIGGIDCTKILKWYIDPKNDMLAVALQLHKELRDGDWRLTLAILVFKVSLPIRFCSATGGARIGATSLRVTLNFIGASLDLIFCRGYGPAPQGLAILFSHVLAPIKGHSLKDCLTLFYKA